jgi:hypothetical protein
MSFARAIGFGACITLAACGRATAPPPAAPDPAWRVADGVRTDDCPAQGDACTSANPAACDAAIDAGGARRAHATRVVGEACARGDRCACARFGRALSFDPARPEEAFRALDRACRDGALPACDDGLLLGAMCAARDARPTPLCAVLRAHGRVPPPEPEPPTVERLPLRPAMRGCFVASADGACPATPVPDTFDDPKQAWLPRQDPCGWRVPGGTLLCFDDEALRVRVPAGAIDGRMNRMATGAWDYVPVTWVGTRASSTRTALTAGSASFALREEQGQIVQEAGTWRTPLTRAGPANDAPTAADLRRACAHARACILALAATQPPTEGEGEAPGQEVHGLRACEEQERAAVAAHRGVLPQACR